MLDSCHGEPATGSLHLLGFWLIQAAQIQHCMVRGEAHLGEGTSPLKGLQQPV